MVLIVRLLCATKQLMKSCFAYCAAEHKTTA